MFTRSGKRLTQTALPDINIPSIKDNIKLNDDNSNHFESLIDDLLMTNRTLKTETGDLFNRETITAQNDKSPFNQSTINPHIAHKTEPKEASSIVSQCLQEVNTQITSQVKKRASKVLMNYQLLSQGKPICNVQEIPQFIFVFTSFKTKDTTIVPPNNFEPEYTHVSGKPNKNNKPRSKFRSPKKGELSTVMKTSPKEKKVEQNRNERCKTPGNVVQRERAVQTESMYVGRTSEVGVQVNLDDVPITNDNSELEWVNHIIETHVLTSRGDIYECHICGEVTVSYASKVKHSMVHKESSSLCFHCGLIFANHVKLKKHEKKVHLEQTLEIRKALRCPKFLCTKAFHSKRQLFDHIDQHHIKKTDQRCSRCQRTFSSSLQLHCHKSRRRCWR